MRIHGVETDFAEYYTYDYLGEAAPVVYKGKFVPATLQYQRGTGAYRGQVRVHDVARDGNDATLRGFRGATRSCSTSLQHVLDDRLLV